MDKDEVLRDNLLALLTGEHARMSFEDAVREFPMDRINEPLPGLDYSPWFLLEHIRLAQADILDFIKGPTYKDKVWPRDYWPAKGTRATSAAWEKTVTGFKADFKELQDMVEDRSRNLYAAVPWGEGEIFLREIVTVANHNAFHLGEFAIMREAMGTWPKGHKG